MCGFAAALTLPTPTAPGPSLSRNGRGVAARPFEMGECRRHKAEGIDPVMN